MSNNKNEGIHNHTVSEKRRKVLKATGAATIAGAAVWQKPMLNSVVLPAHAQTSMVSMPLTFSGSTGTSF